MGQQRGFVAHILYQGAGFPGEDSLMGLQMRVMGSEAPGALVGSTVVLRGL